MKMDHTPPGSYDAAIWLLRQIQADYHLAREQLQEVSARFTEKEALATSQLRTALDAAGSVNVLSGSGLVLGHARLSSASQIRDKALSPAQQSLPSLELRYFGSFEARAGLKRIDHWSSLKARSLLKYLASHGRRPIPKDVLMEVLWPGCDPAMANNNLKAAVRSLRQTLTAAQHLDSDFAWVLYQDGNYRINSQTRVWIDVEQFENHWRLGRLYEKEGKLQEAVREHEMAEALYKGDFLEDDVYEEWTFLQREALKDIYLAILGRLADCSLEREDHEDCILYCQKILARDSCREDAFRRLMSCYSRLGQKTRAIAWYRICEKTIRTELGVPPSRATVESFEKLLKDERL